MGTDLAEMGAPGVLMSQLLRVSIGREWLFLIVCLFIAISSHLFAQFFLSELASPLLLGNIVLLSQLLFICCAITTKGTIQIL